MKTDLRLIKTDCLLECSIRSPRCLVMLVYNWIPIFHLVKIFAALIRPMLLFNGYDGYADYIKKLFSMHFCTNWALN